MRTGKLAEPVRKRSVLRQLNTEKVRAEKLYGTDCLNVPHLMDAQTSEKGFGIVPGILSGAGSMVIVTPDRVPGSSGNELFYMVHSVMNSLLAAQAKPLMLLVQGILPEKYEESQLQNDMRQIAAVVKQIEVEDIDFGAIPVMAGQLEVSAEVQKPCYIINGVGQRMQQELVLQPGQELVMTRWIALAGTAILAESYEEELKRRYPFSLIDRAKEFEKLTAAASDARAVTHFGTAPMHALGQGGVFGALWEMAERAGVGLEVDLKKIPVKQETIEICEYFDINPYELYSAGSFLVGTEQAEALIAELAAIGIEACVIGRITGSKDRVIRNGEDCRFLDRPKQDEWYHKIEQK